jgi:hypothetical protein
LAIPFLTLHFHSSLFSVPLSSIMLRILSAAPRFALRTVAVPRIALRAAPCTACRFFHRTTAVAAPKKAAVAPAVIEEPEQEEEGEEEERGKKQVQTAE